MPSESKAISTTTTNSINALCYRLIVRSKDKNKYAINTAASTQPELQSFEPTSSIGTNYEIIPESGTETQKEVSDTLGPLYNLAKKKYGLKRVGSFQHWLAVRQRVLLEKHAIISPHLMITEKDLKNRDKGLLSSSQKGLVIEGATSTSIAGGTGVNHGNKCVNVILHVRVNPISSRGTHFRVDVLKKNWCARLEQTVFSIMSEKLGILVSTGNARLVKDGKPLSALYEQEGINALCRPSFVTVEWVAASNSSAAAAAAAGSPDYVRRQIISSMGAEKIFSAFTLPRSCAFYDPARYREYEIFAIQLLDAVTQKLEEPDVLDRYSSDELVEMQNKKALPTSNHKKWNQIVVLCIQSKLPIPYKDFVSFSTSHGCDPTLLMDALKKTCMDFVTQCILECLSQMQAFDQMQHVKVSKTKTIKKYEAKVQALKQKSAGSASLGINNGEEIVALESIIEGARNTLASVEDQLKKKSFTLRKLLNYVWSSVYPRTIPKLQSCFVDHATEDRRDFAALNDFKSKRQPLQTSTLLSLAPEEAKLAIGSGSGGSSESNKTISEKAAPDISSSKTLISLKKKQGTLVDNSKGTFGLALPPPSSVDVVKPLPKEKEDLAPTPAAAVVSQPPESKVISKQKQGLPEPTPVIKSEKEEEPQPAVNSPPFKVTTRGALPYYLTEPLQKVEPLTAYERLYKNEAFESRSTYFPNSSVLYGLASETDMRQAVRKSMEITKKLRHDLMEERAKLKAKEEHELIEKNSKVVGETLRRQPLYDSNTTVSEKPIIDESFGSALISGAAARKATAATKSKKKVAPSKEVPPQPQPQPVITKPIAFATAPVPAELIPDTVSPAPKPQPIPVIEPAPLTPVPGSVSINKPKTPDVVAVSSSETTESSAPSAAVVQKEVRFASPESSSIWSPETSSSSSAGTAMERRTILNTFARGLMDEKAIFPFTHLPKTIQTKIASGGLTKLFAECNEQKKKTLLWYQANDKDASAPTYAYLFFVNPKTNEVERVDKYEIHIKSTVAATNDGRSIEIIGSREFLTTPSERKMKIVFDGKNSKGTLHCPLSEATQLVAPISVQSRLLYGNNGQKQSEWKVGFFAPSGNQSAVIKAISL